VLKKILLVVGGLVLLVVVGGVAFIGPRNVIGIIRYGHTEEGNLFVGDRAPDVALLSLDGKSEGRLLDAVGPKPLVLIFGSFT